MRKILLPVKALALVVVLLVASFLAIGGWQMVTVMRGPVLPSQHLALTSAGDLEYLRQVVLANERGLSPDKLSRFDETIRSLSATPPANDDAASIIAARALATLDNAHSTLTDPRLHRLPIRVRWFSDGLFIVKARPERENLLGAKITAIGGKSPQQLLQQMRGLVGGNEPWRKYRSEYFLVAPAGIAFLGGDVKDSGVTLAIEDANAQESSLSLMADVDVLPGDAFWEWENQLPGDASFKTAGWKTLLNADARLPLYLQEPQRLFLLRDLPEDDAVYIRMNGSINDDGMPIKRFAAEALSLVESSHRKNVIVDFRFNWGGGYDETITFTRDLPRKVRTDGQIYLITGPNTFSAGLIAGARLKHFGGDKVVIAGQPAGDDLQFRAEGFLIKLPATGMTAYVSTARHDFQHPIGWLSDCYFLDKIYGVAVDSIAPSVFAQNTGQSYRTGQDEVLETIFNRIKSR